MKISEKDEDFAFPNIIGNECGESFSQSRNLNKHKKTVHAKTAVKEYFCNFDDCLKTFESTRKRLNHRRQRIMKKCEYCEKQFRL